MPTTAPGLVILNTALCYSSLALFALIGILAMRDARQLLQGRLLALLAICLAGLTVTTTPEARQLSKIFYDIARLIGIPNVGLIWWFSLSLLRDDFRLDQTALFGMLALCVAPLSYFVEHLGWVAPFANVMDGFGSIAPFAMIAHIFWVALSERSSDLVEPRRRARLWIVLAVMISSVVSLVSEYLANSLHASLLRQLATVPAQLLLFLWLTRLSGERLTFTSPPLRAISAAPEINPKDAALHRKLMTLINADRVYLQPGLSIEMLAKTLEAPTHQLRHLINSGLGYRNFASFLSQYRLAYAKAALADGNRARDTVISIPYESGFASLQTFNRVFKDIEGITPSDFRAAALAKAAQI